MYTREALHSFALKWFSLFSDEAASAALSAIDENFEFEARALGFPLAGQALSGPEAARLKAELKQRELLLADLDRRFDAGLLMHVLLLRWLSLPQAQRLTPEEKIWFILVLSRIEALTAAHHVISLSSRRLHKISLSSYYKGEHGREEQWLELYDDGWALYRVLACEETEAGPLELREAGRTASGSAEMQEFSGAAANLRDTDEGIRGHLLERKRILFDQEHAEQLLAAVAAAMELYHRDTELPVEAQADWILSITDSHSRKLILRGSFQQLNMPDGTDLSEYLREHFEMNTLCLFDARTGQDAVSRICVDYHRSTQIRLFPGQSQTDGRASWDYYERLCIDRERGSLEYVQKLGSGNMISKNYIIFNSIEGFLDSLNFATLLRELPEAAGESEECPDEKRSYRLTVDYKFGKSLVQRGTFNRNGLPKDWPELAERIRGIIQFYQIGDILDESLYAGCLQAEREFICCTVVLEDKMELGSFLTEDSSLAVGDTVCVRVPEDGRLRRGIVTKLEYRAMEELPRQPEQMYYVEREKPK